jgi:hypothetical protein
MYFPRSSPSIPPFYIYLLAPFHVLFLTLLFIHHVFIPVPIYKQMQKVVYIFSLS